MADKKPTGGADKPKLGGKSLMVDESKLEKRGGAPGVSKRRRGAAPRARPPAQPLPGRTQGRGGVKKGGETPALPEGAGRPRPYRRFLG